MQVHPQQLFTILNLKMTSKRAVHELVDSSFSFYNLCMSYINFNPNPDKKNIGDCVVRAVCAATDCDWESAYIKIVLRGFIMHDMPSSDDVWGAQLYNEGFIREIVPNTCPYCYTVKDFCEEHTDGVYVLGTGTHAVCVKDGDYYDAWDSGDKVPLFYWRKEA